MENDKGDSYKLAKLLRLGELPVVYLPSKESDALRTIVRYRKSIGEDITMVKNRIHAILTKHGIIIHASDIFGRKGLREIVKSSHRILDTDRMVMDDLISRISDLMRIAI